MKLEIWLKKWQQDRKNLKKDLNIIGDSLTKFIFEKFLITIIRFRHFRHKICLRLKICCKNKISKPVIQSNRKQKKKNL